MVVLITTTVTLLLLINLNFFRRSVMTLADEIIEQTLGRVELQVQRLLDQAISINNQTLRLIQDQPLAREDLWRLDNFFAKSLEVQQGLTSVGLSLEATGEYIMAERAPDGFIRVREYLLDETGQMRVSLWHWRGSQREFLRNTDWDGFDPRQRPFYRVAKEEKVSGWTETYPFWQEKDEPFTLGISYVTPWLDGEGKLIGVINADFRLQVMCSFLGQLEQELPGYAIVIEKSPKETYRLIAHPRPACMLKSGGKELATTLGDIKDGVVVAYLNSLIKDQNTLPEEEFGRRFKSGGNWYLGAYRSLSKADQPPWVLAMMVPREAITAGITTNAAWSLVASMVCLLVALLIALWYARRIARPLQELSNEAESVGRLEFETTRFTRSNIREVRQLQHSMGEMKASLRSFSKYVPAELVHELIESGQEARLGGQARVLTIFFSDIVEFTSISENLTPQALVQHVGEYLSEISDIILQHQGTVDKYIGDGVMAFWGAPQTNTRHAADACRAAWRIDQHLDRFCDRWQASGKPPLRTRMGLHTGEVIVGNIGSETRMNYTLIGDAVNLASRMEGLNKYFGTRILLSESTREAAGDSIVTRPVSRVLVKGKLCGVLVYELLGLSEEAKPECLAWAEQTANAFNELEAKHFDRARELYAAILKFHPNDSLARVQRERCVDLAQASMSHDTDTLFRIHTK